MNRFYYEFVELESTGDEARCDRHDDAQKIVDALNAYRRPSLGVFG